MSSHRAEKTRQPRPEQTQEERVRTVLKSAPLYAVIFAAGIVGANVLTDHEAPTPPISDIAPPQEAGLEPAMVEPTEQAVVARD